jgi:hypothetical protein
VLDLFARLTPPGSVFPTSGFTLMLASPVANEPPTPLEMAMAEDLHAELCTGYDVCDPLIRKQFLHLVKVVPARTADGSNGVVFTFNPS